jgi:hypothetical protein
LPFRRWHFGYRYGRVSPTLLFDFPDLGPGATVTEPFDPVNGIGIYELQWDPSAPVGFVTRNGPHSLTGRCPTPGRK